MKKLIVPFLLVFLLTGCVSGNASFARVPSPSSTASVPDETILIQPKELLLLTGETALLICQSVSGEDAADVVWTVEDDSIATISEDGTVTAISTGKTTAVAQRKDAPHIRATCLITVEETQMLSFEGAKIEINNKKEGIIASDGTECTMIFEMHAENVNGVFQGQAMLQSIGVKDVEGEIPAVGMMGLVSQVEFTLEVPEPEEPQDGEIPLVPLIDVKYRGTGTFRFILTDVGFMALEIDIEEDDIFLEIPFEVIITDGDKVGIGFTAPDGQYLTFQGELLRNPAG